MSNEAVYITTPAGRFVMGDAFTGSDKDHQGRPRFDKKGQPKMQWFIGVAIPKNDPGFAELWAQINAVGQRDFPAGEWQRPDFAWKVVDGDGVNTNGQPYPDYCKGHYIVRMSSGYAPTVYNAQNQPIVDPAQCKRGDYVQAYISVKGNDDRQKPGVYISHQMIRVVGYGEAIVSGPSAEQAFGAPAALPPGASATPVAPSAPMPAAPGVPAYAPPAGAVPPTPALPTAPTSVAPVPTAAPVPAALPASPTAYPSSPAPAAAPVATPTAAPGVQPYPSILNGPQPQQ